MINFLQCITFEPISCSEFILALNSMCIVYLRYGVMITL